MKPTPDDASVTGGPLGPPCPVCGMFEGSAAPGHLCLPPEDLDDGWPITAVGHDGSVRVLCTLQRFDLAERRADDLAHSIARNDHGRVADGRPCSGIRALVIGWDLWVIDHESPTPTARPIDFKIPRQRMVAEAGRMLGLKIRQDR